MTPDDVVTPAVGRNSLEFAAPRDDSHKGAAPHPVGEDLQNLVSLLGQGAAGFSRALGNLPKDGQLDPLVRASISNIKAYAQVIVGMAESVTCADTAAVPHQAPVGAGVSASGSSENAGSSRRASNKAFDFLLLEALHAKPRVTVPIGLGDLALIAKKFDPDVKHGSLVAKLNRWKNDDKFLAWTSHEDMHLTTRGIARRTELLPLARKTGRLDAVNDAIFAILGVRSSY